MIREYEQYYYTWIPAMGGAAVYAASAAGDTEGLKNLCRSADFDAGSAAPTYRLTYCEELSSFVFLCAQRMEQSLDGRATPFVHIYRPVGTDLDTADYVAPRAFHGGSKEDLAAASLERAKAEVKADNGAGIKISEELLTELIYLLYFGVYRDKNRLVIRCRHAPDFEENFRRLTVFLYSLAPSQLREKLSVSMSAARLSEGCKADIVTDNVDIVTVGNEGVVLEYADGTLTRAARQKPNLFELQAAVCRHLARLYQSDRSQFVQLSHNFFSNYTKLLSESRGSSFSDNMAAYYLLLGEEKPDIADIPAASLLDSLKMSLKFYQTWPYAPHDYENLLLAFTTKYLLDGATDKGNNVLKIIGEMPLPDGCAGAEKLGARLLDDLFETGQAALANETFGRAYREDSAFAEKVAAQVRHTEILGKMPPELSLEAFLQMCNNGITRHILFDEKNKDVVLHVFYRALDTDTPEAEWKQAFDKLNTFQKGWCGELCQYILTQKPDKFSLGIFMLMCSDPTKRAVLFEKRSKNTVLDSFFHAISSDMPAENLKRAADKLNKCNAPWYEELCRLVFAQINSLLADHFQQCKMEDLCRVCSRTSTAFAIDRDALWETAVNVYLAADEFDESRLSQVCHSLSLPDSRYREAVKQKKQKQQKKSGPIPSASPESAVGGAKGAKNQEKEEKGENAQKAAPAAQVAKVAKSNEPPVRAKAPKQAKSPKTGATPANRAATPTKASHDQPAADNADLMTKIMPMVCEAVLIGLAWLIGFLFRKNPVINRDLVSAAFTALSAFALMAVFSVKNSKPFRWEALPSSVKDIAKLSACLLVYMLLRALGA